MGLATVVKDVAAVYGRPTTEGERADEMLYGMSVQIVQESESGWAYIRTEYGAEGYIPLSYLEKDANVAAAWRKYRKMTVLAPYIDVQLRPETNAPRVASLSRGGILVPLGTADATGFMKVGLANGGVGYTRGSYLGDVITDWTQIAEEDMRWNIVETALSYNGAAYRTGGRSPLGIDGIGLAAMSYYLNGVSIPRELHVKPGGVLHAVRVDDVDEGDLLFFPESVGIYMGEQKFVHACSLPGVEGVIVSSMRPRDDDYLPELAENIISAASLF